MRRSTVNFVVDLIGFADLLALAFTGAIMKWVLPPGTGGLGRELHGGIGGDEGIELFWGLGRHDWGAVHFWLAVLFLALMVVHLFLHWKWIKSYVKSLFGGLRKMGPMLVVGVLLSCFWSVCAGQVQEVQRPSVSVIFER